MGTGVNTHPKFQKLVVKHLSKISGKALRPTDYLRYAMQSNLAMSVASSALRNLALELIRISNDIRLMSSGPNTGVAEIELPALQPGSSIMPGKNQSRDGGTDRHRGIPSDWSGYRDRSGGSRGTTGAQCECHDVMMPAMAWKVSHSAEILKNTVQALASKCVDGISAKEERCNYYFHRGRLEFLHRIYRSGRNREGECENWTAGRRNCIGEKSIR